MKKLIGRFAAFALTVIIAMSATSSVAFAKTKKNYTWNISLNHEVKGKIKRVKPGTLLVIDAQNYKKKDITKLKKAGYKVYSYLNIGSVEDNRRYYGRFKSLRLKTYENWEDEYWVNVSRKKWQNFVQNTLAKSMVNKGVDGFWVDNTDVYEYNKRSSIYKGLVKILTNLHKYHKEVVLNGGDQFVTPLIKSGKKYLINGVVQEEVNTRISSYSGSGSFSSQRSDFRHYYENYFKTVKKAGLSVGLLEYTRSGSRKAAIRKYCKKHGFNYCIKGNIII